MQALQKLWQEVLHEACKWILYRTEIWMLCHMLAHPDTSNEMS